MGKNKKKMIESLRSSQFMRNLSVSLLVRISTPDKPKITKGVLFKPFGRKRKQESLVNRKQKTKTKVKVFKLSGARSYRLYKTLQNYPPSSAVRVSKLTVLLF